MSVFSFRALALAACACISMAFGAPALAMTVQPVVIDMTPSGRQMSTTVSVQNTFTTPLPVELTVQELTFDESGAKGTGKDPGDLLIFPPQALIPPGETQAFRIQWVGDPELARSKHFYVTVAQLPVKLPEGQSAIQILYNFQVLVNVAAADPHPELSVAKAEIVATPAEAATKDKPGKPAGFAPAVWIRNAGNSYGYLSRHRMQVRVTDASGKEVAKKSYSPEEIQQSIGFGVIGPDTTRRIVLPIEVAAGQGQVTVEISDAGGR
jgi:P pilus assembly chaperone PapD